MIFIFLMSVHCNCYFGPLLFLAIASATKKSPSFYTPLLTDPWCLKGVVDAVSVHEQVCALIKYCEMPVAHASSFISELLARLCLSIFTLLHFVSEWRGTMESWQDT